MPAPQTSDPPPESLAGMVERVTFHSAETGFTVLRVKARGHRDLATVVGRAPEISPGEWIEARGRWGVDPKHGPQFKAEHFEITKPDSIEGIEKYLGSGLIHGVGPVCAGKLVKAFGREVFDVIDRRSALLLTVEGIGPTRRDRIKAAWSEQKVVREIMTFLLSHGVSTARAFRIYRAYGEKAIERVRLDPYCLARDIVGIGFKTADAIAERVGIARDSPLRADAGVEHTLLELTGQGHCAFPRGALVERAAQALQIEESAIAAAVARGIEQGRLVERTWPGEEPLVYLAPIDFTEGELARLLRRLAAGQAPLADVDAGRALAWVEDRIGLTLDPAQREAVAQALRAKALIVTGGPGTGKTTLVRAIVAIYRAKKRRVVLCAPTGRAAKRLSESARLTAKTIHRLLAFDPKTGDFKHNAAHPLAGDLFVADEASMLDVTLAYQLVRALPPAATLVLVGDVDQLPSVGPGAVLRDLIDSGALPVVRLQHVFRQAAQSLIVANAHRINAGALPEIPPPSAPGAAPADFYFVPAETPEEAVARILRLLREAIPRRFRLDPFESAQVLTPMQRGELGARNLNRVLQDALNPRGAEIERFGVRFREGDKVMQMQNNYDKDVFNGDIGRIARIEEERREVAVVFDGRRVDYRFEELDELALSYAVTVHKSQGSEYPCVIVPVHTQHFIMLKRNLLYTAVTRGRRLVVLVGTRKAIAIAVRSAEAVARFTTLRLRLE